MSEPPEPVAAEDRASAAEGRVAVVTGASRGIGEAIAHRLAADGYSLALVARSAERLDRVAAELPPSGATHTAHVCDVGDRDAVTALGEELRRAHRRIDAIVNNAGVGEPGVPAAQLEHWDDVLATNLRGPVQLIAALEGELRRCPDGGAIVNVGSLFGFGGAAGSLAYVASKAALHAVTRSLAVEYGRFGIRVNAVAPGFIQTDMFDVSHPPERRSAIGLAAPLGRVGDAAEVAAVVAFLCSSESSFVSGAVVTVDGGLSAKLAIPEAGG
jgi:NAD(P)-dependent dehydrogenase (short-subunit alcohol dehydrogenase family)